MAKKSIRYLGTVIIGLSLVALSALVWWQLHPGERPLEVDLDSLPVPERHAAHAPVRFAVAPVLSPEQAMDAYLALADYLATRLHRPVRTIQRKTYHEVNELLRHSRVQLAVICTGAYLSATMEKTPLEVIAVPVYREGPVYHSFFLVSAESDIETLAQLKGRRFAFSDPLSLSGHYYPLYAFLRLGVDPGTFFSETTFTYSHDGSMRAVLDGIADAAGVDSLVYDFVVRRNPDLEQRLRIIHRSPALGVNPIVVPDSLEAALRLAIQEALLDAPNHPQGQKVLAELGIERFAVPQSGLYDNAAKVYVEVRAHLEKKP